MFSEIPQDLLKLASVLRPRASTYSKRTVLRMCHGQIARMSCKFAALCFF